MALTQIERDFINFVEHYYFTHGQFPPITRLEKYASDELTLTFDEVMKMVRDLDKYFAARGIIDRKNSRLTDQQLAAVNLVCNFEDKRPVGKKLKDIGLTPTQWQGWVNDPIFSEYLRYWTEKILSTNTHHAHLGLMKGVERGDASSLKLYYEVTGRLKKDNAVGNISILIVQLVEIIQRYINDPEVLRSISSDFDLVLIGYEQQENRKTIEGSYSVTNGIAGPLPVISSETTISSEPIRKTEQPSRLSPSLNSLRSDSDGLFD